MSPASQHQIPKRNARTSTPARRQAIAQPGPGRTQAPVGVEADSFFEGRNARKSQEDLRDPSSSSPRRDYRDSRDSPMSIAISREDDYYEQHRHRVPHDCFTSANGPSSRGHPFVRNRNAQGRENQNQNWRSDDSARSDNPADNHAATKHHQPEVHAPLQPPQSWRSDDSVLCEDSANNRVANRRRFEVKETQPPSQDAQQASSKEVARAFAQLKRQGTGMKRIQ